MTRIGRLTFLLAGACGAASAQTPELWPQQEQPNTRQQTDVPLSGVPIAGVVRLPPADPAGTQPAFAFLGLNDGAGGIRVCLPADAGGTLWLSIQSRDALLAANYSYDVNGQSGPVNLVVPLGSTAAADWQRYPAQDIAIAAVLGPSPTLASVWLVAQTAEASAGDIVIQVNAQGPASHAFDPGADPLPCDAMPSGDFKSRSFDTLCRVGPRPAQDNGHVVFGSNAGMPLALPVAPSLCATP